MFILWRFKILSEQMDDFEIDLPSISITVKLTDKDVKQLEKLKQHELQITEWSYNKDQLIIRFYYELCDKPCS